MSREESGERQAREFEASERTRLGPGAGRTAFGNQALARSGLDLGNMHREGQGGVGGLGPRSAGRQASGGNKRRGRCWAFTQKHERVRLLEHMTHAREKGEGCDKHT